MSHTLRTYWQAGLYCPNPVSLASSAELHCTVHGAILCGFAAIEQCQHSVDCTRVFTLRGQAGTSRLHYTVASTSSGQALLDSELHTIRLERQSWPKHLLEPLSRFTSSKINTGAEIYNDNNNNITSLQH